MDTDKLLKELLEMLYDHAQALNYALLEDPINVNDIRELSNTVCNLAFILKRSLKEK